MSSILPFSVSKSYYENSIKHRNEHKCGGYPYANGLFLNQIIKATNASKILEIGTAIGYSAYCFATGNNVEVTTIDLNEDHQSIAQEFWKDYQVKEQITMLIGDSKVLLKEITENYDIVFFDGFAPDPDEAIEYSRIIGDNGLLLSTNLSWNKTTPEYLSRLDECGVANVVFDDTSLSSRSEIVMKQGIDCWKSYSDK